MALAHIKLAVYQPQHRQALCAYRLPENQLPFAYQPYQWLSEPLASELAINAHLCAVTVLADGQPVGFFVLDNGALCLNHQRQPGAVLLRSLSINPAYQGQGIAKAAVAAHRLDAVVRQHDPDSQRLILGVNRCNTVASDLYLAAGFYDTGVYINGVAGAQHIFQRKFA